MLVFVGAKQAGVISLLSIMAAGYRVHRVVAHDDLVKRIANDLGLPVSDSMEFASDEFIVNCHGRKIIKDPNGINIHPCLYLYKGARPVRRLLDEGVTAASVGAHRMTNVVDEGEFIFETLVDVTGCKTEVEVYNKLYPYYAVVTIEALRRTYALEKD